jgi:hypothetical protein
MVFDAMYLELRCSVPLSFTLVVLSRKTISNSIKLLKIIKYA